MLEIIFSYLYRQNIRRRFNFSCIFDPQKHCFKQAKMLWILKDSKKSIMLYWKKVTYILNGLRVSKLTVFLLFFGGWTVCLKKQNSEPKLNSFTCPHDILNMTFISVHKRWGEKGFVCLSPKQRRTKSTSWQQGTKVNCA